MTRNNKHHTDDHDKIKRCNRTNPTSLKKKTMNASSEEKRNEQNDYYYVTTDLGSINYDVTAGNPLKGLVPSPRTVAQKLPPPDKSDIPYSLEFCYIGWDEICQDENVYDWSAFESMLNDCASRHCHLIPRVFIHYPGQEPLRIPQYLIDQGIELREYHNDKHGVGMSPVYSDPILLQALQQFITEFSTKYDGDHRIAFIQLGLLGFWGEWHTNQNPDLLPEFVKDQVLAWYTGAFHKTKLQTRNPRPGNNIDDERRSSCDNQNNSVIGYHDDSYAFTTLDGDANGAGSGNQKFFFWRRILDMKQETFWIQNVMGGEIRPELTKIIFEPDYPARTKNHQDCMECIQATHTTYLKNMWMFRNRNRTNVSDDAIAKANYVGTRMGYNFIVTKIGVQQHPDANSIMNEVTIDVTVRQIGVAPFYYPLDLVLKSSGANDNTTTIGRISDVEKVLIHENDEHTFRFANVSTEKYSTNPLLSISLESVMVYPENPIKFAQDGVNTDNGSIAFALPLPTASTIEK